MSLNSLNPSEQIQIYLSQVRNELEQSRDPVLKLFSTNIGQLLMQMSSQQVSIEDLKKLYNQLQLAPTKLQQENRSPSVVQKMLQQLHPLLFGTSASSVSQPQQSIYSKTQNFQRQQNPTVNFEQQMKQRDQMLERITTELKKINDQLEGFSGKVPETQARMLQTQKEMQENIEKSEMIIVQAQESHLRKIQEAQSFMQDVICNNLVSIAEISKEEEYIGAKMSEIKQRLANYQNGLRTRQQEVLRKIRRMEQELQALEFKSGQFSSQKKQQSTNEYLSTTDLVRYSTLF